MNRIKFLILAMLLALPATLMAQKVETLVSGKVVDGNGNPLVQATAFVIEDTLTQEVIAHTTTDEHGCFRMALQNHKYVVGISYVGYKMYRSTVDLSANNTVSLGTVVMEEDTGELQTVVVKGQTMRVRTQPDGFSVDVSTIRQNSNDALDILRRLPQINVKGDQVKVVGKQNVVVQIGKTVQRVDASEIGTVLKGYDASLVQRVEVLQQPPLRYDPDGNTAMIILHMSSIFNEYMGGVVGSELIKGAHYNYRWGGYGTLLYNRKNLMLSVEPAYNANGSYHEEDVTYDYGNSQYRLTTPSRGGNDYYGLRATAQYSYNSDSYIGITGGVNKRKIDSEFLSTERNTPASSADADNVNTYDHSTPKVNATAYMEHTFGARKNKMWAELSYYNYHENDNTDFQGKRATDDVLYLTYHDRDRLKVSGYGLNNDYSIALDNDGRYKLDTGFRLLLTSTSNKRGHEQWYLDSEDNTYSQDNAIDVQEYGVSPYVNGTMTLSQAWWLRVGLRTDLTMRRMKLQQEWQPFDNFTSWLPSLHLAYTPSRSHRYTFTVNSSVAQPKYGQINPFEWRVSQKSYSKGNAGLKPETHHNFDLGYSYNGILSLAGQLRFGHNVISSVSVANADGTVYTQPENAMNRMFYGINASYYFYHISWMSVYVSGYYGGTRYTSDNPHLQAKTTGEEWGTEGYVDLTFNKSRTFTGYISGNYTGRTRTSVATLKPQYEMGAGVNCFLLNRRLTLSLAGMNLFASRYKGYSNRDGYTIAFNNRYAFPTLYFSVSYKFSKAEDKSPRRQMSAGEVESRF